MGELKISTREIAGLQGLRAIAALAVVAHHAMEEAGAAAGRTFPDWLTTCGAVGVDVFFVISGFLMLVTAFDFRSAPLTAGEFLTKRLLRIYPFYWLCCVVMGFLMSLGLLRNMPHDLWFWTNSVLLLPSPRYVIGVAWTLAYEMVFYLVFSFSLLSASRTQAVLVTVVVLTITVFVANFGLPPGEMKEFLANPIMFEFGFGLLLAWALNGKVNGPQIWVGVAAGAASCLAALLVRHESTNGLTGIGRVIGWGVPSVFIVWSALRYRQVTSGIARFGVRLGNASYALYLTHPFVMVSYAYLLKHTALQTCNQLPVVAAVIALSILIGIVAHEHVEVRLLALIAKALRRPIDPASQRQPARVAPFRPAPSPFRRAGH